MDARELKGRLLEGFRDVPDSAEASTLADRAVPLLMEAYSAQRIRGLGSAPPIACAVRTSGDALLDCEERFGKIFERSPLGIALVSPDGRPNRCNPALERMLGYSEAELQQMSFPSITHPDDVHLDVRDLAELRSGRRSEYQVDKRYFHKDGRLVWARLSVAMVPGPEGEAGWTIKMVEDITERRRGRGEKERLVHDLRERVKELTALHGTARLLQDHTLKVGARLEGIVRLLPAAFQNPESARARLVYGEKSAQTPGYADTPSRISASFQTADGLRGTLDVVYVTEMPPAVEGPFLAEERSLIDSMADMLRVALDERLTGFSLRQSEERLALALTSAEMGVWEWTTATNAVTWSEGLERLAGLAPGSFGGTLDAFVQRVHPDDRRLVSEAIQLSVTDPARKERFEVEFRFLLQSGDVRWVLGHGRIFRDAEGRPTRMLGVAADITARRRLEQQFQQAQKMEAIGQLAGGVAHDFNNLLTVITGYTELLMQKLVPGDPARGPLNEIKKAGERSASLTHQLLAFSRSQMVVTRVLDLNGVVRDVEKMLHRLIGEDIQLATLLQPGLRTVRADAGQIEQVLVNLAVNSRDAMPQGGKLTIETCDVDLSEADAAVHPGVRAGPYVRLSVTDTGVGISEAVKGHLFEPFFTTKAKGKGTGLGLAVVHGIVRQSGGHIEVESTVGSGTCVRIHLPLAAQAATPERHAPGPSTAPRGSETILVVEDEQAVRELSRRVLAECGYAVLVAGDGDEALRVVHAHSGPIHLAVTDVVMPGTGGAALAVELLRLRPDMRILYLSGYTDDEVVRHGISQDQVDFLQKPFSPLALAQKVAGVLGR